MAEAFEWVPLTGLDPQLTIGGDLPRVAQIEWQINNEFFRFTLVVLLFREDEMAQPVQQWPWIFSHCVAMHDTYPKFLEVRAALLVKALPECIRIRPSLLHFKVDSGSTRVDITRQSFYNWTDCMWPVTSMFKGKFKLCMSSQQSDGAADT
jgi:hypothetical protein